MAASNLRFDWLDSKLSSSVNLWFDWSPWLITFALVVVTSEAGNLSRAERSEALVV